MRQIAKDTQAYTVARRKIKHNITTILALLSIVVFGKIILALKNAGIIFNVSCTTPPEALFICISKYDYVGYIINTINSIILIAVILLAIGVIITSIKNRQNNSPKTPSHVDIPSQKYPSTLGTILQSGLIILLAIVLTVEIIFLCNGFTVSYRTNQSVQNSKNQSQESEDQHLISAWKGNDKLDTKLCQSDSIDCVRLDSNTAKTISSLPSIENLCANTASDNNSNSSALFDCLYKSKLITGEYSNRSYIARITDPNASTVKSILDAGLSAGLANKSHISLGDPIGTYVESEPNKSFTYHYFADFPRYAACSGGAGDDVPPTKIELKSNCPTDGRKYYNEYDGYVSERTISISYDNLIPSAFFNDFYDAFNHNATYYYYQQNSFSKALKALGISNHRQE